MTAELLWLGAPMPGPFGTKQYEGFLWQYKSREHEIRIGSIVCMEAAPPEQFYIGLVEKLWETAKKAGVSRSMVEVRWFYRTSDCAGAKIPSDVKSNEVFISDHVSGGGGVALAALSRAELSEPARVADRPPALPCAPHGVASRGALAGSCFDI